MGDGTIQIVTENNSPRDFFSLLWQVSLDLFFLDFQLRKRCSLQESHALIPISRLFLILIRVVVVVFWLCGESVSL